jgi:hypothetical protein
MFSLAALSLMACGSTNATTSSAGAETAAPDATRHGEVARAESAPTPGRAEPSPSPQDTPAQSQPTQQPTPARAQEVSPAADSKEARAEEVLKLAREALGGEAKLAEVQSLSVSGPFRRAGDGQQQTGELRVDVLAPDKLKVSETLDLMAGLQLTMIHAVNGAQTWADSRTGASNAQVTMMRRDDKGKDDASAQVDRLQSDLMRYLLAFILTPPPGVSVSFSYAGEAEAPDGRADVLDVVGAHGFKARLFIDKKTHRPLMFSYRDVVRRAKTVKASAGAGDVDKLVKRAQSDNPAAPRESDVQIHLSDYRAEKGLLLPHALSMTVDGQPYQEWEVKEVKLNPRDLTAQKFEKGK